MMKNRNTLNNGDTVCYNCVITKLQAIRGRATKNVVNIIPVLMHGRDKHRTEYKRQAHDDKAGSEEVKGTGAEVKNLTITSYLALNKLLKHYRPQIPLL